MYTKSLLILSTSFFWETFFLKIFIKTFVSIWKFLTFFFFKDRPYKRKDRVQNVILMINSEVFYDVWIIFDAVGLLGSIFQWHIYEDFASKWAHLSVFKAFISNFIRITFWTSISDIRMTFKKDAHLPLKKFPCIHIFNTRRHESIWSFVKCCEKIVFPGNIPEIPAAHL